MPVAINDIFSKVQSSIGDLAMEKYQRGEYVDTMNRLAEKIARATEVWISRYSSIPNPLAGAWTSATVYASGQLVQNGGNYYYCNTSHTSGTTFAGDIANWDLLSAWASGTVYALNDIIYTGGPMFYRCVFAHTASASDMPPNVVYWENYGYGASSVYNVKLPFSISSVEISPHKFIRVVRGSVSGSLDENGNEITGWTECEEFSQQAIGSTISGNASFNINNTSISEFGYQAQFTDALGAVDGSLTLIFGKSFTADEQVTIDYISGKPFKDNTLTLWDPNATNPVQIPEFLYDCFRWGLQHQVAMELLAQGNERMADIVGMSERIFDKELMDAIAYSKKFKDNRSSITIQPLNWLAEKESQYDY